MEIIGLLWNELVTRPMTNGLVFLYTILGRDFGLAIIVFTLLTRIILFPLTVKQLKSTKAMQQLQPKLKAMQEKFKNDRAKQQREQMLLFKEAGVSPLGCLGPMIIQLPIFIGMFYAIRNTLADTPEKLIDLSLMLYSWLPGVDAAVPLKSHFLGLDLGLTPQQQGGVVMILLPVLVGASMYVVQKMTTMPTTDPRQQSTNQMMTWMFPLMFGFFTLSFPNGLAMYWIITNVVSIALQYKVTGWGGLARQPAPVPAVVEPAAPPRTKERRLSSGEEKPAPKVIEGARPAKQQGSLLKRIFFGGSPKVTPPTETQSPAAEKAEAVAEAPESGQEKDTHGRTGDQRQNSRRSYRQSGPETRGRPRRRRGGRSR